jgi:hypothetical protein
MACWMLEQRSRWVVRKGDRAYVYEAEAQVVVLKFPIGGPDVNPEPAITSGSGAGPGPVE